MTTANRIIGRGRIKPGAIVCMDLDVWCWPDLPHGDSDLLLDFSDTGMSERLAGVAPRFGARDDYGNGGVMVKFSDVEWVIAPEFVSVGEAI